MAFIIPTAWLATTAYTTGLQVNFGGVTYEALNAITSSTNPSQDGTNWEAVAVTKVQDYNSLVEAVRLQLNVRSQPEINDSVPLFIQMTEESFKTRIRAPQQRKKVILEIDSEGRIEAPGDLLEVINIRTNTRRTNSFGSFGRESIEILNGNYEEFQEIRQYFSATESTAISILGNYESPVYWFDNRYFNIAPLYPITTEIELIYYATIPQLGETLLLTNTAGEAINADSQTLAEFILAGFDEADFVQATSMVTQNWFTAAAPQMLLYGACLKAKSFLRSEDSRITHWEEMYVVAEKETQELISRFEDHQHHTIQVGSAYLS